MATLTFCGAAGTVTGSCSRVESGDTCFLVDCGLFQGTKTTQSLNYKPFPFDASNVDFLVLTHAHIDHSGLLPKLVKAGFTGKIFATEATCDLLEFMLKDSAYIQETNTERLNRKLAQKGEPLIEPIYSMVDAEQTLQQLERVEYAQWFTPEPGVRCRLWNAGHLLGSASAEINLQDADSEEVIRMLFSGDLGPDEKAFHPEPDAPAGFDYVVCESTYGDRNREDYTLEKRREMLREELTVALKRGGNVVIPSFAVERSQELLHDIGTLLSTGQIPECDVYLDSPLAGKVTEVFIKHAAALEDVEIEESKLFRHRRFHIVESVEESKAINHVSQGAIIISASGMCTAGRIKHHLKNNIWRRNSTILFVGYQAPGTLGQIITSGAKRVRIYGKEYKVEAAIRRLGNYSAHADQAELIDWVLERGPVNTALFLNHGEDDARAVMREELDKRGLERDKILMPHFDESFELIAGTQPVLAGVTEPRLDESLTHRDWHNVYAQFMLDLNGRLGSIDDNRQKQALMQRLAETLRK
ncbi:MBL fold metallo-hydrolase [Novipirellula artificiosorum]|uniref:Ribonuclease n=1 Tax=Novipirellula artificiosorum TaxID=2528016 RepID=A0A5C6DLT0_9BACT|nr:MBL fold metallo-hydrolase [Novipirellula artificiosorum]TWU35876.1 Ribonuclease [Novipirellula artificiosorum]